MFTRLAEFRLVQSRRTAPGPREAFTHSNDNLPGLRRPAAAGRRRSPTPALACHWFDRSGRLECCWQVETNDDAPIADVDEHEHSTTGRVSPATRRCNRAACKFASRLQNTPTREVPSRVSWAVFIDPSRG
jgi:hypothetical protein